MRLTGFVTTAGHLFWLDGSPVTFSVWAKSPQLGSSCGHILGGSGFQWEAASDCTKKLPFICQFGPYPS